MIGFVEIDGGTRPRRTTFNPKWEHVLEYLHLLDGANYSTMTLGHGPDKPPWLQVCGGDNGLVMCQYMWDTLDGFKMLLNPDGNATDERSLTIGGQTTDRWTTEVLHTHKAVHDCLRYFCENEQMSPEHHWE
ncbi:hypothetical protein [Maioricimonas sp. JC845]|uniref:hypothetical protein n=1 Tax=Maioricimonas sp. JC845 TaxID=3232138 RepID=UPI0034586CD4